LCRRIKETDDQRHIPVILLTSLSDPQGVIRGLACGADNFITKPYNEGLLLSRITDMLENRHFEQGHSALPGLEISFACQKYLVTSDRRQILDLLLSTYEAAIHKNNELITARDELHGINEQLEKRVDERTTDLAKMVQTLQNEIVERKAVEEELLNLNRLYAVLSETNQAIVRTKDRDTLFCDFSRIAVEDGGFKLAWVGLADEENGEVKIVASSGATGYLDGIRIAATEEPEGLGPTGITVREGTSNVCNDFLGSPLTRPWHDRARAHGIHSMASIALKQEGRVVGALTLCADKTDYFGRQEVDLLRRMGADISFALDFIVRESRRRKAEQSLMEETAERLMAVEALREKEQMLIHQNRQAAMGEMIGNIAHQWRQPLNTLGLIVQQLPLYYDIGELTKESLDGCVVQSMNLIQHMSKTIDDFRNYFRPDKDMVVFKASEAIKNTLSFIEDSFKNQRIRIEVTAKHDPAITGYPNEYAQVLLNILNNARDALIEREVDDPRVTISIFSNGDRAVVTISDNAGGIPDEIMGKIFDPYFTTKGPQTGTGVGLFMSKTIIEKNMGGRLVARNTANGAEFRIEV
jgi:C4-dicarboxylate-specific signal transduction histidine kinase